MNHSVLRKSQCLNKYLHRFSIVEEYEAGVLENCEICHQSAFFKIINGKPDNQAYMDYHIRSVLPPNHPLYYHEHNYEPLSAEDLITSPYI